MPQSSRFGYILTLHISFVVAQDFAVPSTWRTPTTNLSHEARLAFVDGLFDTINQSFNSLTGLFNGLDIPQSANMLSALSIGDRITNTITSKKFILDSLNTAFGIAPTIVTLRKDTHLNSDAIAWGLAAMNSYRAYNDSQSLQNAESIWTDVSQYMVTPQVASAGKSAMKNATIPSACHGVSTAGAVFYIASDPNDTTVNGATVGGFMALSAHLYEQTSDEKYLAAAELSADFVTSLLYDGNVILDKMDLQSCSFEGVLLTSNSGIVIDGLSVLAGTNSSWTSFVSNLLSTAVTYPSWTNTSDGIIIEGPTTAAAANTYTSTIALKGIFVRSLYEAYTRMQNDSDEAKFIRSFILVQYNALLDLASSPGQNQYSPKWEGPPPATLLPWGQLAALDVLTAAAGLGDAESPSDSSPSSPTDTPSIQNNVSAGTHRGLSGGAIGGIVAGCVILILLVLTVTAIFVRMRKAGRHSKVSAMEMAARPYSALGSQLHISEGGPDLPTVASARPLMDSKRQPRVPPAQIDVSRGDSTSHSAPPSSRSVPDSVLANPTTASWNGNNDSSVDSRPSMVEFTALRSLVERINRALVLQPSPGWVETEEPPRYEG